MKQNMVFRLKIKHIMGQQFTRSRWTVTALTVAERRIYPKIGSHDFHDFLSHSDCLMLPRAKASRAVFSTLCDPLVIGREQTLTPHFGARVLVQCARACGGFIYYHLLYKCAFASCARVFCLCARVYHSKTLGGVRAWLGFNTASQIEAFQRLGKHWLRFMTTILHVW